MIHNRYTHEELINMMNGISWENCLPIKFIHQYNGKYLIAMDLSIIDDFDIDFENELIQSKGLQFGGSYKLDNEDFVNYIVECAKDSEVGIFTK